MTLDSVLIREPGAKWPNAYAEYAESWRLSAIEDGRLVEWSFGSREEAQEFAARRGVDGNWADPDGDGNYCVVG